VPARRGARSDAQVATSTGEPLTLIQAVLAGCLSAAAAGGADVPRAWVRPDRCPPQVQLQALGSVSSAPRNWKILHYHFQKFGQCDSGAIAEGYSYGVVTLLAHRWNLVGELAAVGRTDPTFLQFVLAHVDATTAEEDLRQVQAKAETACPPRHRELCRRVGEQARAALGGHQPSPR
jgi:hypothetical protein